MRARNLKPGFFKNELLGASDPINSIIFEGLWCLADREGRLEDRPARIHVEINPYRPVPSTVQALCWLVQERFVLRYTVNGVDYLQIVNFSLHQQPHVREPPSKIPPPSNQEDVEAPDKHSAEHVPSTSSAPLIPDSPFLTADSRKEGESARSNGKKPEPKLELHATLPLEAWTEWLEHRKRKRWPNDATTLRKQLNVLAPFDTATQAEILATSINAGWQGVFPPKTNGSHKPNGHAPSEAMTAWDRLIATEGAERPPKAQAALQAIGGWQAIRMRDAYSEPRLKAQFREAYDRAG